LLTSAQEKEKREGEKREKSPVIPRSRNDGRREKEGGYCAAFETSKFYLLVAWWAGRKEKTFVFFFLFKPGKNKSATCANFNLLLLIPIQSTALGEGEEKKGKFQAEERGKKYSHRSPTSLTPSGPFVKEKKGKRDENEAPTCMPSSPLHCAPHHHLSANKEEERGEGEGGANFGTDLQGEEETRGVKEKGSAAQRRLKKKDISKSPST